jgi:type IV secretion system protein VirB4
MMSFDIRLKKAKPKLLETAQNEISSSEFIPYACHYNEHTILTKSGDLLQVIKIAGLSFETADPDWLTFQKDVRNTILRSIGKIQYAIYAHTIRRKRNVYPDGSFPAGFSNNLNEAWRNKQSGLELYVNDFYLTIIHKSRQEGIAGLRDKLKALSGNKADTEHAPIKNPAGDFYSFRRKTTNCRTDSENGKIIT